MYYGQILSTVVSFKIEVGRYLVLSMKSASLAKLTDLFNRCDIIVNKTFTIEGAGVELIVKFRVGAP